MVKNSAESFGSSFKRFGHRMQLRFLRASEVLGFGISGLLREFRG